MKNIIEKSKKYIELSGKEAAGSKLTAEEAKQVQELRRELSARGLDPQHVVGLDYRALVFAYKSKVATFVAMRENDKYYASTRYYLQSAGIEPDQQRLGRMLAEFKQNAKSIAKKKTTRGVCMARQERERAITAIVAEISEEDAQRAAEELAAEEKARQERERMSRESITAFAAEAFGV
jgi:signal transduction histidine kinase